MTIYTKPAVLPAWAEDKVGVPADLLQPSDADIRIGWPLSSTPPSRQRFNWLLNYAANAIRYMLQRGLPAYDAAEDYPLHARVQDVNGNEYRCIQAGVNHTPATSPLWWRLISDKVTRVSVAGGTVDAITVDFVPDLGTVADGDQILIQHAGANTVAFTINADGAGAVSVYKGANAAVVAGDIPGADFWGRYVYDASLAKWQMMNPATGISSTPVTQLFSQPNPTLAANAMTLPASNLTLQFRSATLADGVVPTAITGAIAALVVPAGATLGTISAMASSIVEIVMNNGGTMERAVVNLSGGVNLDETGLISTTILDAASDAANVVYSATARSNLPYRVVRRIDSTQTVAGNWAQALTLVQGAGGNALNAMQSLGYGQRWQNLTGSRALATTYYNTTSKPINVVISPDGSTNNGIHSLTVNGIVVSQWNNGAAFSGNLATVSGIVPPGGSYSAAFANGISFWYELR